jgi:hypothetical protein
MPAQSFKNTSTKLKKNSKPWLKKNDNDHITAADFTKWFANAKPGERIIYYTGKSFIADCEEIHALDRLRDAVWAAGFEVFPRHESKIILIDKKTLHLMQHRVGPKPEDNKSGIFEYVAINRGGGRS